MRGKSAHVEIQGCDALRIGLRVPPCAPLQDMVRITAKAEDAGFHYLWVPDSQLLWHDVWATLGALAIGTDRIILGTNVTNPVTRQAAVTAGASRTVMDAAPGRFVLGIGVGDSSVRIQGRPPARMGELRRYVSEVRTLLSGEAVPGPNQPYRMVEGRDEEPMVYVSATGPKMLQLAGEIGDGAIFVGGIDEASLEYARQNIASGASQARRDPSAVDIAVGCFAYVGDDIEYGMALMRPYAAVFALRHPDLLVGELEVPGSEQELGFYPDLGHARDWDAAVEATDWVPDGVLTDFCERYCLIGDGPTIRGKVERLAAAGVDNLYVRGVHSYELPHAVLDGFAEHVLSSRQS